MIHVLGTMTHRMTITAKIRQLITRPTIRWASVVKTQTTAGFIVPAIHTGGESVGDGIKCTCDEKPVHRRGGRIPVKKYSRSNTGSARKGRSMFRRARRNGGRLMDKCTTHLWVNVRVLAVT